MMKTTTRFFTLTSLSLIPFTVMAEVDSGTGSPQEVLTVLDWLLGWLPI